MSHWRVITILAHKATDIFRRPWWQVKAQGLLFSFRTLRLHCVYLSLERVRESGLGGRGLRGCLPTTSAFRWKDSAGPAGSLPARCPHSGLSVPLGLTFLQHLVSAKEGCLKQGLCGSAGSEN